MKVNMDNIIEPISAIDKWKKSKILECSKLNSQAEICDYINAICNEKDGFINSNKTGKYWIMIVAFIIQILIGAYFWIEFQMNEFSFFVVSSGFFAGVFIYVLKIMPIKSAIKEVCYQVFRRAMYLKYSFSNTNTLTARFLVDRFGLTKGDSSYGISCQYKTKHKDKWHYHFKYFYYTKHTRTVTSADGKSTTTETYYEKHNIYGVVISHNNLPKVVVNSRGAIDRFFGKIFSNKTTYQPTSPEFRKNFVINSDESDVIIAKLFSPRVAVQMAKMADKLPKSFRLKTTDKHICITSSRQIIDFLPRFNFFCFFITSVFQRVLQIGGQTLRRSIHHSPVWRNPLIPIVVEQTVSEMT